MSDTEKNSLYEWQKMEDPKRRKASIWRFFIKPPKLVEIRPSRVVPDNDDKCDPILVVEPNHVTTIILFEDKELYFRQHRSDSENI